MGFPIGVNGKGRRMLPVRQRESSRFHRGKLRLAPESHLRSRGCVVCGVDPFPQRRIFTEGNEDSEDGKRLTAAAG